MKKYLLLENYSEFYNIAVSEHDSKEDAQLEMLSKALEFLGEERSKELGLTENITILKDGYEIVRDDVTVSLSEDGACVSIYTRDDTHWQIEEIDVSSKQVIYWNNEYLDINCIAVPAKDEPEKWFYEYVVQRTMELLTVDKTEAEALVTGKETALHSADTVSYCHKENGDLRASIIYDDYTEYLKLTDTP